MERPVDHVHLLIAREPYEVDRVPRHANRQRRILFGMIHGIQERFTIQHVNVDVIAGDTEESIKHFSQVLDLILGNPAQTSGN